jgi:uncharacterized membrane protein
VGAGAVPDHRRPGAVDTTLFDINDRGQIVGARPEADGRTFRGFVLEGGRYRTFAAPGAQVTVPGDINDRGQIVGFASIDPATETARGFLLARRVDGPFTSISVPGAPSTVAFGLNDRGQITGTPPHRGDGGRRVGQLSGAVTPPLVGVRRTVSSLQAVS